MTNLQEKAPSAGATALEANAQDLEGHRQLCLYHFSHSPRKRIRVEATGPKNEPIIEVGQVARVLIAMVWVGKKGVTPLDPETWSLRLYEHVGKLRKRHGLIIERIEEPHDYGRHARYVLRSSVKIEKILRD